MHNLVIRSIYQLAYPIETF